VRLLTAPMQVTAASNFTHEIQHVRRAQHTLVTTGIYRYVILQTRFVPTEAHTSSSAMLSLSWAVK